MSGNVEITFLAHDDMHAGASCSCYSDLHFLRQIFEPVAKERRVSIPTGFWYISWDHARRYSIVLDEIYYYETIVRYSEGVRMQEHFKLTIDLLHELAHACVSIWQPRICRFQEPLIRHTDTLTEAGLS